MTNLIIKLFLKNRDTNTTAGREAYGKTAGIVGIICNVILSVMKLIVGTLSGSISITADGINNFTDAGTSIVTIVGFKMSGKPADKDHPYGHARIEYITGLIISFIILLIGFEIFTSSVEKIINPTPSTFDKFTAIVLVASIFIKFWLSRFNKKLGKAINSKTLYATAQDSRNDCISTLVVLISAIISHLTQFNLDGIMGVGVAIFIFISGINLTRDTISPLLGQPPSKEVYEKTEKEILSYENVLGVHDLMIHSYGPGSYFASAHIEMDARINVLVCHDIMDTIERDFLEKHNIHLVVHLDPTVLDSEEVNELKALVTDILADIDPIITFHDFRVVTGDKNKNVLFDVVVPMEYKYSDIQLIDMIKNRVKEAGNGTLHAVVLVDKSYGELKSEND